MDQHAQTGIPIIVIANKADMLEKTLVSRMNTNFDTFTSDADKENLRKSDEGKDLSAKDLE